MKLPNLKSIVTALAVATAANSAGVSGNLEYNMSEIRENNMPELNLGYSIPGEIKGFTFLDFLKNGTCFGKTYLDRNIWGPIDASVRLSHGPDPLQRIEIGATVSIPVKGVGEKIGLENSFLKGTVYAGTFNLSDSFEHDENMMILRGKAGADLPKGFKLFAFADYNMANGQFAYGEADISKRFEIPGIGEVEVAYNPCIKGEDMTFENRVAVRIPF